MRSWMIGTLLGILPVGLWPQLPGQGFSLLLVAVALLLLLQHSPLLLLCSGVCLGVALGVTHGNELLLRRLPPECVRQPLTVSGVVVSLPRVSQMPDAVQRQRFEFLLDTMEQANCNGPHRLLLSYYGEQEMLPGSRWRFVVKLKRPWGLANPGSFNMQAWFAQTGIDAVGSVTGEEAELLPGEAGALLLHQRLRLSISNHIAQLGLQQDVAAILRAITVADKSGIDHRLWSLLQLFGINHLLVISGLHVGLVAGSTYLLGAGLMRILSCCRTSVGWLPAVSALLGAGVYAALAGFTLSTQRALFMLLCFMLAKLAGRASGSANNLLLAAVLILVLNPLAALGSGLWLSFGAVAALLWLSPWQRGLPGWRRLALTHGYMALFMLPLGAWWFGGTSLVAALANLLMIPLVGLVVVPLALLAVLSYLCALPTEALLWRLAAWPLEQLIPLAQALADSNGHSLFQYLSAGLPAVLLGLLAVVLMILPAGLHVKALAAVLMLPLLLPVANRQESISAATRVTVMDVGQGTAVLIRASDRVLLYDTGGGDPVGSNMATTVLLPYMRSLGVEALDTFIVSHADADHSAGAASILQALPVKRLRYGGEQVLGFGAAPCVAGEAWQWPGGQRFRFLSPAREMDLARNDASCVLQLELGTQRLLLTGDIERERERELVSYWGEDLRGDWLLVAHHGSGTSSTATLLKTVRPHTAVLSHAYANRFGHPRQDVLQRLLAQSEALWSTADSGALLFEYHPGQAPQVHVHRSRADPYWM